MLHEHVHVYISIFIMGVYNMCDFGACASRVFQGLRMNLVTINDSFKHHSTTATKRTKKNTGIERSKKKKTMNKQAKKWTDWREKKEKKEKKRKEEGNVLEEKKKKKKKKKRKQETRIDRLQKR